VCVLFCLHFLPDMPKLELLTFATQCSYILKVWWEVLYGFCWKFTWHSSSERIFTFENPLRIDKVIAMSSMYYFFGTQCTSSLEIQMSSKGKSTESRSVPPYWSNFILLHGFDFDPHCKRHFIMHRNTKFHPNGQPAAEL